MLSWNRFTNIFFDEARYGNYKEYHTSLDKLGTVVTKKGLEESYKLIKDCIILRETLDLNGIIMEPFLSKRNLIQNLLAKQV